MINLDPALVNQDDIRKKRRKKLMVIAVAPFSLLMIISLFFLSAGFYNLVYAFYLNGDDYSGAHAVTETRFLLNILEPYIAPYNQGVADLKAKEYYRAENEFRTSLQENPPQEKLCTIYVNLSLSIELQADQLLVADKYDEAIEKYNLAEFTLYNNGCASRNGGRGKDSKADSARDRVNKKREDAVNEMNGESGNSGSGSGEGEGGTISEEELNKILQEGGVAGNDMRGTSNSNNTSGGSSSGCDSTKGDICW